MPPRDGNNALEGIFSQAEYELEERSMCDLQRSKVRVQDAFSGEQARKQQQGISTITVAVGERTRLIAESE
jgi:hypothetical protein